MNSDPVVSAQVEAIIPATPELLQDAPNSLSDAWLRNGMARSLRLLMGEATAEDVAFAQEIRRRREEREEAARWAYISMICDGAARFGLSVGDYEDIYLDAYNEGVQEGRYN